MDRKPRYSVGDILTHRGLPGAHYAFVLGVAVITWPHGTEISYYVRLLMDKSVASCIAQFTEEELMLQEA